MIKRVVLAVAVVIALLAGGLIVWDAVTSRMTSDRVRDRTAYWNSVVHSGVAIGQPRDQAERWLRKTLPDHRSDPGLYDSRRRSLVASAEAVEVVGSHFPCAEWVIIVDIQLDASNRVASRDVRTSGICV